MLQTATYAICAATIAALLVFGYLAKGNPAKPGRAKATGEPIDYGPSWSAKFNKYRLERCNHEKDI